MLNFKQEYIKCYNDKSRIYFIENYLSTFNAMERKDVPFKLFPRQKVYLQSAVNHNNIISKKHRQAGITTLSAAWVCGQCVFSKKGSPENVLCIANKLEQAVELTNKIVGFLDQVPRWMWGSEYYSPDPSSDKNKKSIYVKRNKGYVELFNGCKIYARASSPHAARGVSSVTCLIMDECAFLTDGMASFSSAVAAMSAVTNAKCFLVSTPNGKDQLYYGIYQKALKGENNFYVVEFKWFQDLRYNRNLKWFKKDEKTGEIKWDIDTVIDKKGNIIYNEERWRELEKNGWTPTSPWFENMCKTFNNDEQKIAQEILVSFLGSADNVVPIDTIEEQSEKNVIKITEDWNLRDLAVKETWIWKDPNPTHRYICSCLPKGETVITNNGLKKVENITFEDKLYDVNGNITNIKKIYQRYVNEEIITFKLYNNIRKFSFTKNHPIYVSTNSSLKRDYPKINGKIINGKRFWEHDFVYTKAEKISSGDWFMFPNIYRNNILSNEEILEKWTYDKIDNPLLNEDFWWYCGMWLAEGCCVTNKKNNTKIYTSHFINENDIITKTNNIINKILLHKPLNSIVKNSSNCLNIFYNFNYLGKFLNENFGKYAHGKYISEWIKFLPQNFKLQLLLGYMQGDGSFVNNKRDSRCIKASSVSQKLIEDLQDILFSLGIITCATLSQKPCERILNGRTINCRQSYEISIGKYYSQELFKLWGIKDYVDNRQRRHPINYIYFSNDLKYIYCRIHTIEKSIYDGAVYNFETTSHNYNCQRLNVHNCDPSSGSGEDKTSIEIIDVDAIDENGFPYFEQVLEYNGKLNGQEIGGLIDKYARIYNNALVVIDAIGGYGDAVILTLLDMNYPNLYYDETGALKNYTNDYARKLFKTKDNDKLPGFRSNALRIQMISNFVEMLKNNSFRVRSERVISELDTWVFKNGRPDHMDGMHDDNLTCLAMGLFVAQYYMLKTDKIKQKDTCIVQSWYINNSTNTDLNTKHLRENVNISNRKEMARKYNPFTNFQTNRRNNTVNACIMLGGFKIKKET